MFSQRFNPGSNFRQRNSLDPIPCFSKGFSQGKRGVGRVLKTQIGGNAAPAAAKAMAGVYEWSPQNLPARTVFFLFFQVPKNGFLQSNENI